MTVNSNNDKRNKTLEDYFKANYNKLVKKVSGRAETKENAEDIVMDAFARALKFWPAFDPEVKPIEVWFGVILQNSLRDHMRFENNFGMSVEFDEQLAEGVDMSQTDQHMVAKIKKIINTHKGLLREVLTLYFVKGYTPIEISQVLDVKGMTVRRYASDFRKELQAKYGALYV